MTTGDVIHRHYAALQSRDWDAFEETYAASAVYRDPHVRASGRGAILDRARQLEAPFSEGHTDLQRLRECDDFVVAEWTYTGANHASIALPSGVELPATGRQVSLQGVSMFDLENGLIRAETSYWDRLAFYQQLGLMTSPEVVGSW